MLVCLQNLLRNQRINLAATQPGKLSKHTQDCSSKILLLLPPCLTPTTPGTQNPISTAETRQRLLKSSFLEGTICVVRASCHSLHFPSLEQEYQLGRCQVTCGTLPGNELPSPCLYRIGNLVKREFSLGPTFRICCTPIITISFSALGRRQMLARIPALTFEIKYFLTL